MFYLAWLYWSRISCPGLGSYQDPTWTRTHGKSYCLPQYHSNLNVHVVIPRKRTWKYTGMVFPPQNFFYPFVSTTVNQTLVSSAGGQLVLGGGLHTWNGGKLQTPGTPLFVTFRCIRFPFSMEVCPAVFCPAGGIHPPRGCYIGRGFTDLYVKVCICTCLLQLSSHLFYASLFMPYLRNLL
jgi:hypothetical protein